MFCIIKFKKKKLNKLYIKFDLELCFLKFDKK